MPKFRKKPVVIEAVQITDQLFNEPESWPDWLVKAWNTPFEEVGSFYSVAGSLEVSTLEGSLVVSRGDYLVRGTRGELYPCKPDIFEAIHEPVES